MDKGQCMLDARILQAQGYTQMQIAQLLGVTDRTVRTYLKERPCGRKKPIRASRLNPFKACIEEQLEKNPRYNGELLYERIGFVMVLSYCACRLCGSRPTCDNRRCWPAMRSPSTILEESLKRSSTTICAPHLIPARKVSGIPQDALLRARSAMVLYCTATVVLV